MKCNAQLRPNYFSANASKLAVVFCQKIKKPTIFPKTVTFDLSQTGYSNK